MKEYLSQIVEGENLIVIRECLLSLKVSIQISEISDRERERMDSLIELMLKHVENADFSLNRAIDFNE